MKLLKASYKAIKYACMEFHYSKALPVNFHGYSVFNDKNEWCGCIVFGGGAANNLAKPYNLVQGQVRELVRIALNGKQEKTSQVIGIALNLIKKDMPACKLLVSYADSSQDHFGTVYQATNWYYTGQAEDSFYVEIDNRLMHRRSAASKYGSINKEHLAKLGLSAKYVELKKKYKYIYPLDKSLIPMCKGLSKPYPKKCGNSINGNATGDQSEDDVRVNLAAQSASLSVMKQ